MGIPPSPLQPATNNEILLVRREISEYEKHLHITHHFLLRYNLITFLKFERAHEKHSAPPLPVKINKHGEQYIGTNPA